MLRPIPDITDWKEKVSNKSLMELGEKSSLVLVGSAKQHYWQGAGPLSLKFYLSGKAKFRVGNRDFVIDEQSYLVLNNGEPYEIIIKDESEVEAFCLFFQHNLISDYVRNQNLSDSELLDRPFGVDGSDFEFYRHTFKRGDDLDLKMHGLKWAIKANADSLSKEILLYDILRSLVNRNQTIRDKEEQLDFVRKSTRQELIKRLLTARDFMHASYQKQITLDDIAKASCLSVNHFLRTFKQAFHQTPNQYIRKLRIEKAKHFLIQNQDWTITKICFECGFKSIGYFSSLFKRCTGITPSEYRSDHSTSNPTS